MLGRPGENDQPKVCKAIEHSRTKISRRSISSCLLAYTSSLSDSRTTPHCTTSGIRNADGGAEFLIEIEDTQNVVRGEEARSLEASVSRSGNDIHFKFSFNKWPFQLLRTLYFVMLQSDPTSTLSKEHFITLYLLVSEGYRYDLGSYCGLASQLRIYREGWEGDDLDDG